MATVSLDQLRGKRLEADDFDALLADDPTRDLLQWLAAPQAFQQRCGGERWSALSAIWKKDLKFDPAKDGELDAAERLVKSKGAWSKVWQRFADNPTAFAGIAELLRRAEPDQMGLSVGAPDLCRWPAHNDTREHRTCSMHSMASTARPTPRPAASCASWRPNIAKGAAGSGPSSVSRPWRFCSNRLACWPHAPNR